MCLTATRPASLESVIHLARVNQIIQSSVSKDAIAESIKIHPPIVVSS